MRRGPRRNRNAERGSTIVEFAAIGVILFAVISFLIQSGIVLHAWISATNAAREGARGGSPCLLRSVEPCTTAQVTTYAKGFMLNFPLAWDPTTTVNVVNPGVNKPKEAYVTVSVTAKVPLLAPGFSPIFADGLQVTGRSTMRLENPPQ